MPTRRKAAPHTKDSQQNQGAAKDDFPIVGIGASAGGLETLQAFFSQMPGDTDIAFVIIQHLSPRHKSIMAELLSKRTRMAVKEIEDGMRLSPGCVYLTPPDKNVAIFNRSLHLMEPIKSSGINMPIDFFFRSLAEDRKERAIGIIVSGTASDGTMGIKAIKGEGGMAMAQDPDTAKYDGMPRSAVATGMVDFIVPVEKMPQTLLGYIRHPFLNSPGTIKLSETGAQQQLTKMFALIRGITGHDFSNYKPNTIYRRIERRLAVHQLEKVSDYLVYLQKTPSESKALFNDLLIGVTSFFRDPEAFNVLAQTVAEKILSKKPDEPLRCWVVGCSTGEEAYSMAIVFAEAMTKLDKRVDVQIFASDIDEKAIETARKGVYSGSIAMDVSKERLKRFFNKEQEGVFKVKKQIRDMVVFSPHSIIKDPPFSTLDLVSCRNLMIYMDTTLQKKIIPTFHYALNPEGILFLGTAETIGEFTDLFKPLDSKWRVYQRKEGASRHLVNYQTQRARRVQTESPSAQGPLILKPADLQAMAEKTVLDQYAPAAVLVNHQQEILHFVGRTERYLTPPTGRPSFNILNMARAALKSDIMAALHQASREKKRVTRKGIRVQSNGGFCIVDLSVSPFTEKEGPSGLVLVVFEDKTADHTQDNPPKHARESERSEVRRLEQELSSTREHLQAVIEELETANEELRSTNEELQSVNEQLQSTNEELETSKEELQSTNEELNTVNTELQSKVHELSRTSDDMHNLLTATDIASIFLDTRLCIQRYTPAAARIIKLIPTDIGRPLGDLKTSFPRVDLEKHTHKVLDDLKTVETQIVSEENVWYQLKVMPYRTMDNVIDGVVITLIDIQQQVRQKEDKIRRFGTVLDDSNDAVSVLDFAGRILAWNKGAEKMYGWTETEALKMSAVELLPKERQKEFEMLIDKIREGEVVPSFKTRRRTKSGDLLQVWLTATALTDESGRPVGMATTERDLAWLSERFTSNE